MSNAKHGYALTKKGLFFAVLVKEGVTDAEKIENFDRAWEHLEGMTAQSNAAIERMYQTQLKRADRRSAQLLASLMGNMVLMSVLYAVITRG